MRLPTLIAIAVTMCAMPAFAGELPTAPAPHEAKPSTVVKLRNVAAADAAHAVQEFLKARKLDGAAIAEPVSNTVTLSTTPALMKQLLDLVAALDKEPTQIVVSALVLEVPHTFVEESGLNVGAKRGTTTWTLSPRELHMFTQFIRATKQQGGECDILARPQVQLTDNQTGFVQVGQEIPTSNVLIVPKSVSAPTGITFRATPRIKPDGGLLLGCEVQLTEQTGKVAITTTGVGFPFPVTQYVPLFTTQSVQTTAELKSGETLVFQVGKSLVVVTPTVVAPAK